MPVLKAKPGEFKAWRAASAAAVSNARPLFELVPTHGEDRDVQDFVSRARVGWPSGSVLTFDAGALNQTHVVGGGSDRVIRSIGRRLRAVGLSACPVIRLTDPPPVLRDAGWVASAHGQGVVLRVGSETADPDPGVSSAQVRGTLAPLGLAQLDVDLVIDFHVVASARDVARTAPLAHSMLRWAAITGPWRNVILLSGAFPTSISDMAKGVPPTPVVRFDAALFTSALGSSPPVVPVFGDFGVAHPAMPSAGRGPLPSIRYTAGSSWQVYREAKVRPGNESFFTVCSNIVTGPFWSGSAYSWGDAEIDRCSRSIGGAGTATEWRAFGTSHHIEHVIERVTTIGVP